VVALRTEMRLLKAVSLLRNPATKIIYVARESGFNHLGLFHHCFKKRFGSSPGQWRKANA
jgi:AraC-like DNA-binding protein